MQFNGILILVITAFLFGCVQKTHKKSVVYTLKVPGTDSVVTVGVRGSDDPLSWRKDLDLKPLPDARLYQAIVTYETGYKFTEAKFYVNDKVELLDQPNRRVEFSAGDTTFYKATYNIR